MKFHHIQSTTPFHLRNWSWFALELVEIWDPKRTLTVSPIWGSWKVSPFSTFKGRPKPLNRNSFSRLSTSRMDGFPPRMEVLGSDYDWCLPMVPMISDVSMTSLSKQNWIDWSFDQFKQTFRSFKRLVLNMTLPLVEGSSKHSATMSIVEVRIFHQERHQGQVRRDHLRGPTKQQPWAPLLRITTTEEFI